jgi:hypothetical protein
MELYDVGKSIGIDSFIFGAFAKLRKASLCLSVRPHEITRLPLDGLP